MHIFFNKNSNHFSGGVFSDNLFGKNTVIIMRKIPLDAFSAARGMSFYCCLFTGLCVKAFLKIRYA